MWGNEAVQTVAGVPAGAAEQRFPRNSGEFITDFIFSFLVCFEFSFFFSKRTQNYLGREYITETYSVKKYFFKSFSFSSQYVRARSRPCYMSVAFSL